MTTCCASVESLALADYSEENLVREFWAPRRAFRGLPGDLQWTRHFDLPVLELAALRHGIAAPAHFADEIRARYRYADARHLRSL